MLGDHLTIDDAWRARFGVEYVLLFGYGNVIAFRGGVWYDSDHRARFTPDDTNTGMPAPRWALLFPPGEGTTHFTGGVGFVLQPHFQIDAAIDWSDTRDTISVSANWKF